MKMMLIYLVYQFNKNVGNDEPNTIPTIGNIITIFLYILTLYPLPTGDDRS